MGRLYPGSEIHDLRNRLEARTDPHAGRSRPFDYDPVGKLLLKTDFQHEAALIGIPAMDGSVFERRQHAPRTAPSTAP